MVKNLPAMQEIWFNPWVGKIPWRREWLPIPVFLPRAFHGQRSLAGYNPRGHKDSDTTERLTLSLHKHEDSMVQVSRSLDQWTRIQGPETDSQIQSIFDGPYQKGGKEFNGERLFSSTNTWTSIGQKMNLRKK